MVLLFLQGSVPNKFYVHNDIFRYEDEVFGDSEAELDEGEGILQSWKQTQSWICKLVPNILQHIHPISI